MKTELVVSRLYCFCQGYVNKSILVLLLVAIILGAGCIEPYIRTADVVLFRISPDGEIEWENTVSCPDIFHTSPYIRINAADIPGDGSFILFQYPNESLQTVTRAVILDEKGVPEMDVIVPVDDDEIYDLIAAGSGNVIAMSRGGMLYTFNSGGDIVSSADIHDFTGVSVQPGSGYNSATLAGNGDVVFAGEDKKPGYVNILRISLKERNASESIFRIGGMPRINSIVQTKEGGFLVGGSYSDSGSFPHSMPWVAETGSDGGLLWEKTFGNVNDSLLGFYEDGNGNCHVYYKSSIADETGSDCDEYVRAVVGSDGELKNSVSCSVTGYPKLVAEDGIIFTEYIYETDTRQNIEKGTGLQVTKTNAGGEKEWETLYKCGDTSASSSAIGSGIVQTADGGYLVTGTRYYF